MGVKLKLACGKLCKFWWFQRPECGRRSNELVQTQAAGLVQTQAAGLQEKLNYLVTANCTS